MTDEQFERWQASLTIVDDEAYLPGEEIVKEPRWHWHRLSPEEKAHYHRDRARRYRANPVVRARHREKARLRRARARAMRSAV